MAIKKKVFIITALIYILYLVFPLFADIFNIPVWLPSMATFVIVLWLYPNAFANKTFYWFLAYAFVLTLYVFIGKPLTIGIGTVADSKKIFIEFAFILPAIAIFSVLSFLNDIEVTKRLIKWSIIILFSSFVVTVPLMLSYNSIREAWQEQDQTLSIPGLPGYSLMHAYTLFLPALCYAAKINQGPKKVLAIIGVLILCFVIYDTFVTTSLIIMIAIVGLSLVYSKKTSSSFVKIVIITALVVYILYLMGFFLSLIDWMMPAFEETPVERKLVDFKNSMLIGKTKDGDIAVRQNLHSVSWESFFQNPIFGKSNVGGHSSLIDRFGGMGVVAGAPFVMIIVSFIQRMLKVFSSKATITFFWLGIVAGFIYLYEKGNWGGEAWLMYMVLMPFGILTFEKKN